MYSSKVASHAICKVKKELGSIILKFRKCMIFLKMEKNMHKIVAFVQEEEQSGLENIRCSVLMWRHEEAV